MFKVTMTNINEDQDGVLWEFKAEDVVSAENLDAYVADAQTRWSSVDVSEIS